MSPCRKKEPTKRGKGYTIESSSDVWLREMLRRREKEHQLYDTIWNLATTHLAAKGYHLPPLKEEPTTPR